MLLSGEEIKRQNGRNLIIEPFNPKQLNPNSYNLKLCKDLVAYMADDETGVVSLDMKKDNPTYTLEIPPEGLLMQPGILYLARTEEYTKTNTYVPMLEGRSSIGRLGLFVHITAGFGDVGFAGYWTLEMYCVHPIRIYAGTEICQIYYHTIEGAYKEYSDEGKYQNNMGIQSSMLWKEFQNEEKKIY